MDGSGLMENPLNSIKPLHVAVGGLQECCVQLDYYLLSKNYRIQKFLNR
jgi:hypothetical protein